MSHDSIPRWVPRTVAGDIDVGELVPPTADLRRQCQTLERTLGAHVAAYRAGATGGHGGLCSIYETALLLPAHLERIRAAEKQHPGVVFVAYRRPLRRRFTDRNEGETQSPKPLRATRAAQPNGKREPAWSGPRG